MTIINEITRTKAKDIYDYRIPWRPSPQAFAAYQAREEVLALHNIAPDRHGHGGNHPSNTLHSRETFARIGIKA